MKSITISNFKYLIAITLSVFVILSGCKKDDFLDSKPQTNLVIPSTIADYQALLENDGQSLGTGPFGVTPSLGNLSCDDYYLPDVGYAAVSSIVDRNAYIFATDIFNGAGNQQNWNLPYKQILYANVAIDGLNNIKPSSNNQVNWNNAYSDALFIRAFAYWNLAQVFAPTYDSSLASTDLGLPLKLSSNVNNLEQRSSVQQTYDQILKDLLASVTLAPLSFAGHLNRASKPAVYAMLSRVYLSMRNYSKANLYADSSLQLYSTLIDYNSVNTTVSQPFGIGNAETIYQSIAYQSTAAASTGALADTNLLRSYSSNDLRSLIFFRSAAAGIVFKYGYEGPNTNNLFSGLSSSEMYLTRAECNARVGNTSSAMNDLNTLLIKRWKNSVPFPTYTASSASDALKQILTERRKELVLRSLRWMDLRRLNKEGANIIVKRILSGQTYTLQPNSPLYVFPIPPDEIALSGIQQNVR